MSTGILSNSHAASSSRSRPAAAPSIGDQPVMPATGGVRSNSTLPPWQQ